MYHADINFSTELEKNNELNFLDVFIKRINNNNLGTGFHRKLTSVNICINWNAHAPTE